MARYEFPRNLPLRARYAVTFLHPTTMTASELSKEAATASRVQVEISYKLHLINRFIGTFAIVPDSQIS